MWICSVSSDVATPRVCAVRYDDGSTELFRVREGGAAQRSPLSVRVVTRLAGGAPPLTSVAIGNTHSARRGRQLIFISTDLRDSILSALGCQRRKPFFIAYRGQHFSCPRSSTCERDKAQQEEQEIFLLCTFWEGGTLMGERLPACFSPTPQT